MASPLCKDFFVIPNCHVLPKSDIYVWACRFMGAQPVTGIAAGLSFAQKQQQAAAGSSEAAASSESDSAETTGLLTADVDSEMVQHLRRLSKRDATTKLKALQAC